MANRMIRGGGFDCIFESVKKKALLVCFSFLVCCSRAGENPLPVEPLQPRSEYDMEASELKIQVQAGGPHRPQIKVGADVWVYHSICNVGLQTIHARNIAESLEVNGRIVKPARFYPETTLGPLLPGRCRKGLLSTPEDVTHPDFWGFKPEEPGRYEFTYRVHLSTRLVEENQDNNEIILEVEVEQ